MVQDSCVCAQKMRSITSKQAPCGRPLIVLQHQTADLAAMPGVTAAHLFVCHQNVLHLPLVLLQQGCKAAHQLTHQGVTRLHNTPAAAAVSSVGAGTQGVRRHAMQPKANAPTDDTNDSG
jgi:hypothetical protein